MSIINALNPKPTETCLHCIGVSMMITRHHALFSYPGHQIIVDALLPQHAAGIANMNELTRTQAWKEAAGLTAKPALLASAAVWFKLF